MKLYLDDLRLPPFGWELVKTADACIETLSSGGVEELSLDHDLAAEHYETNLQNESGYREKTGYSVVEWMVKNNVWPDRIIVHTMNPVGRERMVATIRRYAPEHVVCEVRVGFSGRWK